MSNYHYHRTRTNGHTRGEDGQWQRFCRGDAGKRRDGTHEQCRVKTKGPMNLWTTTGVLYVGDHDGAKRERRAHTHVGNSEKRNPKKKREQKYAKRQRTP